MKTKIYAKKTLSVFLAVMMLMSAWVFVAPQRASAAAASAIGATNSNAIAALSGISSAHGATFTHGSYADEDDGAYTDGYNTSYKNVLYGGTAIPKKETGGDSTNPAAYNWGIDLKDSDICGIAFYYPEVTFLYDGSTTPRTTIVMRFAAYGSRANVVSRSGYIQDGNGMTMDDSYWVGSDGRMNHKWTYYAHYTNSSNWFSTTNGTEHGTYMQTIGSGTTTCYAAHMAFTGTMSNTEYVREMQPTFAWKGHQKSGDSTHTITSFNYTGKKMRVINYVPLKAALDEAVSAYNAIKSTPAMFTTESVEEFANLAKALVDAKPTNYVNASSNDYNGYAAAAKNAVDAWNAFDGLDIQNYTVTFEEIDGTQHPYTYAYGTSINCESIATSLGNTIKSLNDNNHQTYKWDDTDYVTTVTDDVIVYEVPLASVAHTYSGWTQDETSHTRTCSVCNHVQTQNHIKGTGYVTTAETCEADGVMTYDCSVCGKKAIETSVINNITGHDFTGDVVENETGENGNHWRKCSRCDAYGWAGVKNEYEAHNWDKNADGTVNASDAVEAKASTCETAGYEKYQCKACNATWTKTLDLADHTIQKTAAKDVSNLCGGDGNEEFWKCSVCGKIWTDEALTTEVLDYTDADNDGIPDVLETKGPEHSYTGAYVSVSGGIDGVHHRQCARFAQCGSYGPEEQHNYTLTSTTSSTCTTKGKEVYTCDECGQTYEVALELVSHSMTKTEAVAATCLNAGNNEYYQCTVCKNYYKDAAGETATTVEAEAVKALGHTFAEGNTDTQKPESDSKISDATCQSPAIYQVTCDRCATEATATYTYGEADTVNGHSFGGAAIKNADGTHSYKCQIEGCEEYGNETDCNYEATKDVASTCQTQGYTTYTCKDCGHGYTEMKDLDAANHEGDTEVRNAKDATCATNGYTGDTYCLGCKTKIADGEDIAVDKTNHENMQSFARVESTCQTAGHKAYTYCDKCETYGTAKEELALKPHKYTTYTSNGDGTHTATCDTCVATVAIPATDTQKCSGGTANCVDKAVCTVCNAEYGEIDSKNHKDIDFITKLDSTCQTEGYEAYRHCDACNSDLDEITVITKKDHVWGNWSKVEGEDKHTRACTTCDAAVAEIATETEACSGGTANCIEQAKCSVCKSAYGDVDPANHKTTANTLKNAVAATCVAPGYTGDYHYNCCDEIKEEGKEIPQLAHSYTVEVEGSRIPATCIAEGEVTFSCATCPEGTTPATTKNVLAIDKTNHASTEEITVGYKAATCTQEGYTGDVYHACCYNSDPGADNKYALVSRGSKIAANGQHVLGNAVPEYMLAKDAEGKAVIITDEEGNKTFDVKAAEPSYAEKIAARHADGKWYHAQICSECGEVVYSACYTYEHTYNCQDTDICEVCKGLCSLINENLHPDGLTLVPGKPATCQEDGVKAYYICEYCGKTYLDAAGNVEFDPDSEEGKEQLVISKDSAPCTIDWDNPVEIVEGTCGTEGYKVYRCTEEGCTKDDIVVNTGFATNKHTWNTEAEIITEPGCGSLGYKAIKCSVCGSIKPNSYETIPATGEHDYVLIDTKEGTSCTDPSIETYECTKCGDSYEIESDEGVSAHTWGEWETIGGDCATGVVQIRTCSVCGAQEQQVVTTVDHDLIVKVRVEATCEEEGYITYVCKNCGYEENEIIPVDPTIEGHVINTDYYVTVEKATCETAEMREYTCLLCGEKVVKSYGEMLNHVWLLQAEEIATCERDGHSQYYRCVRCRAELNEGDIIKEVYPATGHKDADGDSKCDECNKVLYEDGTEKCGCLCHKEGWLMQFIYKIVSFFWKLFKINPSCACGATHY